MYDGDLDWTGHRYGVASTPWRLQLSMIDAEAEQLRDALPPRRAPRRGRRPRHGRLARRSAASTSTTTRSCATGWCCSAARRGSATSTAAAARSTTWPPPGARCSATGPRCSPATRRSPAAGSGRSTPHVRPRLGDVVVAARDDFAVMSTAGVPLRDPAGRPARLADPGRDADPAAGAREPAAWDDARWPSCSSSPGRWTPASRRSRCRPTTTTRPAAASGRIFTSHDRAGAATLSSRLGLQHDAIEVGQDFDFWRYVVDTLTARRRGSTT